MGLTSKEKMRVLEKRTKFILKVRREVRGSYLFHPGSDRWLPAQCNDEGALVIKGE